MSVNVNGQIEKEVNRWERDSWKRRKWKVKAGKVSGGGLGEINKRSEWNRQRDKEKECKCVRRFSCLVFSCQIAAGEKCNFAEDFDGQTNIKTYKCLYKRFLTCQKPFYDMYFWCVF